MGAYSNPQEIEGQFDQTQYSRNLQGAMENITNAFGGAVTSIAAAKVARINEVRKQNAERKEKNDAVELKVAEEQSALNRAIYGAKDEKQDTGMDYATMYLPLVEKYGKLRKNILSGSSADPYAERKEADDIYATVAKLKEGAADTYTLVEKLKDTYGKAGGGAIDAYCSDPNAVTMTNILANRLKGNKKSVLIGGDIHNPGFEFTWTGADGKEVTDRMSLTNLRKALDDGSEAGIIVRPDMTKNWQAVKDANPNIFLKDKNGKDLNIVSKDYLDNTKVRKETTKELVSGKYAANIAEVNKARMFKDPNIRNLTDAQAKAIWLSGDSSAQSLYFNDMTGEGIPSEKLTDGTPNPTYDKYMKMDESLRYDDKIDISPDTTMLTEKTPGYQEFLDNYARLFINTQIVSEQREGAEDFIPNPKKPSNKNKGGKKVKVVESQNDLIKQRNALTNKK